MDLNDKQLVWALTTLRSESRFEKVKQAQRKQLEAELHQLPYIQDAVQMRQAQGRCQVLEELLTDYDRAVEVYEKFTR